MIVATQYDVERQSVSRGIRVAAAGPTVQSISVENVVRQAQRSILSARHVQRIEYRGIGWSAGKIVR